MVERRKRLDGGGGVGMGFVCFLWTVVSHGLEVSFKDKVLGT